MSSHASFSGAVPANYDRYLGPALFEPYAADLVGRLPLEEGSQVLEIACGSGIVTRRLREALPVSARLVATDLNQPMIDYARGAVGLDGIEWQQADAQALPFDDATFDVAVCQFGLMFLPDKVKGFGEARRVLAPGGLFVASVWEPVAANPHMAVIQQELERRYPDAPPRFLAVPHGYNDVDRIRADAEAAGWSDIRIEPVALDSSSTAHDFALGFTNGSPLTHELVERDADLAETADGIAALLAREIGDAPMPLRLAALVITGTA